MIAIETALPAPSAVDPRSGISIRCLVWNITKVEFGVRGSRISAGRPAAPVRLVRQQYTRAAKPAAGRRAGRLAGRQVRSEGGVGAENSNTGGQVSAFGGSKARPAEIRVCACRLQY